ncbi:MAG TPA: septum formation initiator family protein, partial [Bacteroidetes bacterium]|nr:septum formation initiator family protein [Bacteroidota bacterium]
IVIIYYFIIGDYGVITQLRLAQQEREARAKIEVINQEQKNLNRQIARLMEDTAYQEKIAREKYKLAKKGETIYLMVPRPSDSANHKKK